MNLSGYISGDALPLNIQLFDGATSKRPFVYLYSEAGGILSTDEMTHVAGGLYEKQGRTFPVTGNYCRAVYIVKESDGTTESPIHARSEDIFSVNGEKDTIHFIELGHDIPIRIQLWDGLTTYHPIARGYDAAGAMAFQVSLTHVANGYYRYTGSALMTSTAQMRIQYIVNTNLDVESTTHGRALEVYQLAVDNGGSGGGTGNLTGTVSASAVVGSVSASGSIRGTVPTSQNIQGTVSGNQISGAVSASANIRATVS